MTSGVVGAERLIGSVIFWRGSFGFIEVPKRSSWFFAHVADLVDVEQLEPGQRVQFIPTTTPKGPRAVRIERAPASAPPAAERSER